MDDDKRKEILREKILKSEKFEKVETTGDTTYYLDSFYIEKSLYGKVTVMYKNNPVAYIGEEVFDKMIEEKYLQRSREFFGEENE